MTSMHIRHRRLLSADRRLGSQLERDVLAGRAQRHAQGWRDLNDDPREHLEAARGLMLAIGLGAVLWVAGIGIVWLFVQELAR